MPQTHTHLLQQSTYPIIQRVARLGISLVLVALTAFPRASHAACDGFIRWSAETLDNYQKEHRIYPLSADLQQLATKHLPNLWVHPESYRPIDFDTYLNQANLHEIVSKKIIAQADAIRPTLKAMSREEQCSTYLQSPEQPAAETAPVYVQVYKDQGPNEEPNWLYLKYTWVFDWSGLAEQRGWLSKIGALLTGGQATTATQQQAHPRCGTGFSPR